MARVSRGLLDDPAAPHKTEAFSQYPRGSRIMGYPMRTDRYRLTLWRDRQAPYETQAIELYDHYEDAKENVNIAAEQKVLVTELGTQMMKAGILPH